jgi:hypothetical protein
MPLEQRSPGRRRSGAEGPTGTQSPENRLLTNQTRRGANRHANSVCAPSLELKGVTGRPHEDMSSLPTGSGKSRRPGVRPAKAGAFSGRQSRQGKSQKPCSLDGREERPYCESSGRVAHRVHRRWDF